MAFSLVLLGGITFVVLVVAVVDWLGRRKDRHLKEYIAFNEEFLDDMWKAERARTTPTDVSWGWQIPAKYRGYTLADPIVLKDNAALAFKEIVAANGVSNMNPIESGESRRTPPAEGSAPPPSAPTPPPSPEPGAGP